MPIILKGNNVTLDRRLDRVPEFDERSRSFAIRENVPQKPKSYTWACNSWLDQGQEGACVGFSWTHEINAKPKPNTLTNDFALSVYNKAKTLDEYPGEDYEGTSVLAGAKAVVSDGYMGEYRWAFGVDDLVLAVGHAGPAVLGINWYNDMFDVDAKGFVHPTGGVAGGHAILCNGVNVKGRYFRLHNSWGKSWGRNGECFVSFDGMATLLSEQGEACIPIVRPK